MLDNDNDREQSVEIVMLVHETLDLIKSALPHVTVSDPDILAKFIRILENQLKTQMIFDRCCYVQVTLLRISRDIRSR